MSPKTYQMSEWFGPTVQGEGPLAGVRTFFARFAGCDWDCLWCDTKYAVSPKYDGWSVTKMTAKELRVKLEELGLKEGDWLTLSGGNPALFVDDEFVEAFEGIKLAMETQGSRLLLGNVVHTLNCLVVSPKPPSSGMHINFKASTVRELIKWRLNAQTTVLKFVAFDEADLYWINEASNEIGEWNIPRYLSVGTPLRTRGHQAHSGYQGLEDIDDSRLVVCEGLTNLFNKVANDERFHNFIALPQLHTLAWGQKRGF